MDTFTRTHDEIKKLSSLLEDPMLNSHCKVAIARQMINSLSAHMEYCGTLQEDLFKQAFAQPSQPTLILSTPSVDEPEGASLTPTKITPLATKPPSGITGLGLGGLPRARLMGGTGA